jgi:ABC-type enterochelin transport system permease subunit
MQLKHKVGAALAALALVAGAVPGTISGANAYENPNGGQHFDKGRFPRTIHIVILSVLATAGLIFVLTKNDDDRPTSP